MRIPHAALPAIRLGVLAVLVVTSAFVYAYFWTSVGGTIPLVTHTPYRVSFDVAKVDNLVPNTDVTLVGVKVGKVESVTVADRHAHVVLGIDSAYVPLHQGVAAQIKAKTLVEETYVDLTDGKGAALPDGAAIPSSAVTPQVQLDDVLRTLDQPTREQLAGALRSLGLGTTNSMASISAALHGLGDLAGSGRTALDALAAQSSDLEQLSANTAAVLQALDTRQGQIAAMVQDANQLTAVTAGSANDISTVMRRLPGVLDAARAASGSVSQLAPALQPVVSNLDQAAPDLATAMRALPGAVTDLRGLLPALDETLTKAPGTLDRVPVVSTDLIALLPNASKALASLDPMLAYMSPYGHDIATFFTNFGQTIARGDANGTELRVMPVFNDQSLKNNPLSTNGILHNDNPYPAPGAQAHDPGNMSPLLGH